eukprot:680442-Pleurochrysis_carterae.AAC.1
MAGAADRLLKVLVAARRAMAEGVTADGARAWDRRPHPRGPADCAALAAGPPGGLDEQDGAVALGDGIGGAAGSRRGGAAPAMHPRGAERGGGDARAGRRSG